MTTSPPPSTLQDAGQGVVNLFAGWALQIGRVAPLLASAARVRRSRREERRTAEEFGRAMAQAGTGDAYLRQRIEALAQSGPPANLAAERAKLGRTGTQAGVPLFDLEGEYRDARQAHDANQADEARHRQLAERFWPRGPLGWLGLIAGYAAALAGALLLFSYLAPDSVPRALAEVVRPPKPAPPPAPTAEIAAEYKGVKITVRDAVIAVGLERTGPGGASNLETSCTRFTLAITNTGEKPVRYLTWRGHPARRDDKARLNDDQGVAVAQYVSSSANMPAGGVYDVEIAPNATVIDHIDFVAPRESFAHADLFLPGVNLNPDSGTQDVIPLRIPRDRVKKPGDSVAP